MSTVICEDRKVFPTHQTKAYFDAFSGLIPCVVIGEVGGRSLMLKVRITRTKGGYKAGQEILTARVHTIPRECVKSTEQNREIAPFNWELN